PPDPVEAACALEVEAIGAMDLVEEEASCLIGALDLVEVEASYLVGPLDVVGVSLNILILASVKGYLTSLKFRRRREQHSGPVFLHHT
ncbi:hypothetical protein Tco_1149475, partial [Tanacetum coccineum]